MAERYLYIPGIGFTMLFGSILTHSISGHGIYKLFRIGLIAIVFPLFIWSTVSRNRMWLNEFTFSTETIRRSPASFRIYNDLGFFYYHKGLNDAAIQAFKDSIRIRYNQPKAHCNLGAAYSLKGLNDAAIEELKVAINLRNQYPEALKVNPYYADAHNNLRSALIDQGRLDEALSEVEKAVKIRRNFALAHYNMAVIYFKKGQLSEAYNKLLEAYQLDPANADVHISLGVVYLDHFHDKEKALHHIKEALRLNPKHKQAEEMKKTINKLTSPENRP